MDALKQKDDVDIEKLKFFVLSVDTLYGTKIDQRIKKGWRDRPPLLDDMVSNKSFWNKKEERPREDISMSIEKKMNHFIKRACREGVPDALRCSVWIGSVAYFSSTKQKEFNHNKSYVYGTLGKARAIDNGYQIVLRRVFADNGDDINDIDAMIMPTFGLKEVDLTYFLNNKNTRHIHSCRLPTALGMLSLTRVLYCVQKILGIDGFCPILPYLAAIFLTRMPESYVYVCIREMVTESHSYIPITHVEYYQWCKTFSDVIKKMFPETYSELSNIDVLSPNGLTPIFQRFFTDIIPREYLLRIIDIFMVAGSKALLRIAVALFSIVKADIKKQIHAKQVRTCDDFWEAVRDITFSPTFLYDDLIDRAYGNIGGKFFKSLRFPNRRVITRLLLANEKWAKDHVPICPTEETIQPLGLSKTSCNTNTLLAKSSAVRLNLAKWLPCTMRDTKLDLIYSTNKDGRTLESFYNCVSNVKRTIILIEVLQTKAIIGMFANWSWHISKDIYGDGSCFMFRAHPNPICYKWHPPMNKESSDLLDNDGIAANSNHRSHDEKSTAALWEQFMVGRSTYISLGGNTNGNCGLRINEDLTKGVSDTALGYDNAPLPGSGIIDFDIGQVDVYRFIRGIDDVPLDQIDDIWQF